jgi:hypothetical protein
MDTVEKKKGPVRTFLSHLNIQHWAWIHFKLSLGVTWAGLMLTSTPETISSSFSPEFIPLWTVPTIVGAVVSIFGMMMYAQPPSKVKVIGVSIELAGLCLFAIGPFVYFLTRIALLETSSQGGPLAAFSYSMLAVLLFRFIVVVPRFWFEAHDPRKDKDI